MPLTAHDLGTATFGHPFTGDQKIGPFLIGGYLYVVQVDYDSTPFKFAVLKSSDGVTFTRKDSAHEPSSGTFYSSSGSSCMAAVVSGTNIIVGYQGDNSAPKIYLKPFDTTTDGWSSVATSAGPTISNTLGSTHTENAVRIFLATRSNGDIVAVTNNAVSSKATPYYAVWNGSSWTSATQMGSAGGTSAEVAAAVVNGGSDRIHVFYFNTADTSFHSQCIKSDNSLGTATNVGTFYQATAPNSLGEGIGFPDYDGSGTLAIAYKNTSNKIRIATATDADAPSWSSEAVDDTFSPLTSSGTAGWPGISAIYVGGNINALAWNNSGNNSLYRYIKSGGSWDAGTLLYSESSGQDIYVIATASGSNIGFIFNRSDSMWYAETGTMATGPGGGGPTVNIQVRCLLGVG